MNNTHKYHGALRPQIWLLGLLFEFSIHLMLPTEAAFAQVITTAQLVTESSEDQKTTPATNNTASLSAEKAKNPAVEAALMKMRQGDLAGGVAALHEVGQKSNDPEAFFHLGEIYRLGVGRDQNLQVSMMYYRLAAGLGNGRSALSLANLLYFETVNDEAAITEAVRLWQDQATRGIQEALYMLGLLYWNGEVGIKPDPIRGYGLIWRAGNEGYGPAIEAELEMAPQLDFDARLEGQKYAENLNTLGFNLAPLPIDLITPNQTSVSNLPGLQETVVAVAKAPKRPKPENWSRVWRVEVGYAMDKEDATILLRYMKTDMADALQDVHGEVIAVPTRPNKYRIVFGPFDTMQDTVIRCVRLKKNGQDCFSKPPSEIPP